MTASGEPPIDPATPRISAPPHAATGITAIAKSASVTISQMGAARALTTLRQMNQMGGFDCPSCAWPEPDSHRSIAEFCENGAKALASEATRERADPDFFAAHSVAELESWSDKLHLNLSREMDAAHKALVHSRKASLNATGGGQ